LRDLGLELREFELSLNEKKTRIIPVDQEREEDWILALSSYPFPTPTGFVPHDSKEVFRYSQIRPYLALARQLAEEHETSAPIHYALKGVPKNLNERGRRLLCQEAINLSVSRPYLCQSIGTTIFDACPHESLGAQVSVFASTLSRQGLLRLQPDAIAHALFFALKYDARLDLSDEGILPVLDLGDCVCNVLLLLYARRFERPLIARRVKCLAHQLRRGNSKDQDQFWLLIYEVWSEKELRGGGQNFLADLKAAGYSFLSPELVHRLINS